ncbi:hypothetical protein [Spirosoma koreense]
MKKLFYFVPLLVGSHLMAQTNYVANTPNSATPGTYNTMVGPSAGNATMTGNLNTFLGWNAGQANTTGKQNTFLGMIAGSSNTTGDFNAFLGAGAGQNNTVGYENAFVGTYAGSSNTSGIGNAFMGSNAGQANTTGGINTFIGSRAGYMNSYGGSNNFVGGYAGYNNTTGSSNVFLGVQAGYSNTTGSGNTCIGNFAGYNNTTGAQNIFLGPGTGFINNTTTGSSNIFIGVGASVTEYTSVINNAAAFGTNARVSQSNSIVLGGTNENAVNVGIGNTAPTTTLHITTGSTNTSGLRLENLTSSSPATALNQHKFLSVDGNGNVILASSTNSSARQAADLWESNGSYAQNTSSAGVIIGSGISKTTAGYKLFVEEGILTEKVKVAVKNTADWSDKVFEAGYPLRSLQQVEQAINRTGHLPGVPSATEIVKTGIDLGKMDAKLLEKIEELTLYSIQLEKQNQAQQRLGEQQAQELKLLKHKQAQLEQMVDTLLSQTRN